jgi:hypothetical protein
MSEKVYQQQLEVPVPAHLSLRNIRGEITIRPADDEQVTITAIKFLDDGDGERTEVEMWQSEEGNVFVATRYQQGFPGKPCRVDYDVHVPSPCTIALRCVSGSALLERLEGSFHVKMVSGDVSLKELAGSLQVRSVSGDITATQLNGRLNLETVSGNVEIMAAQLEAAAAKTVNGNITLETPIAHGPYRFETVAGDMRLLVPPDTNCTVKMKSMSGRLRLNGTERRTTPLSRKQQMTLGSGGTLVRFSSISGDFVVGQPA